MKYEYKVINLAMYAPLESELNKAAEEGWKFCQVYNDTIIFEREIKPLIGKNIKRKI